MKVNVASTVSNEESSIVWLTGMWLTSHLGFWAQKMGGRGHVLRSLGSSPYLPADLTQRDRCYPGVYVPAERDALYTLQCLNLSVRKPFFPLSRTHLLKPAQPGTSVYFAISGCPAPSSLSRTLTVSKSHCPWHLQGQTFLLSSLMTGRVPGPDKSLMPLSSLPLARKS